MINYKTIFFDWGKIFFLMMVLVEGNKKNSWKILFWKLYLLWVSENVQVVDNCRNKINDDVNEVY